MQVLRPAAPTAPATKKEYGKMSSFILPYSFFYGFCLFDIFVCLKFFAELFYKKATVSLLICSVFFIYLKGIVYGGVFAACKGSNEKILGRCCQ